MSIVAGLMIIPVKVEEVLMLLGLFMEVEPIQMRMRLVFALCENQCIGSALTRTFRINILGDMMQVER
jgi:hypothetical protein